MSANLFTRATARLSRVVGRWSWAHADADHPSAALAENGANGFRPIEDRLGEERRPERAPPDRGPARHRDHPAASLNEAIAAYRAALKEMPGAGDDTRVRVLDVLVARDWVARILSDDRPESPDQLLAVEELDRRLKDDAEAIDALVGRGTLERLRETRQPPSGAWWWSLDERAVAVPRPHPAWAVLTGTCLFASFPIIVYISLQFLSSGADFISVFTSLAQVLLALLAFSTLTQVGQRGVEWILSLLGIKRKFQHRAKLVLALAVLLFFITFRSSLSWIAAGFHDQGRREHRTGQVTNAIESYQRAIALDPTHAFARYNLGDAYEEVREYDKAIGEYQAALLLDPEYAQPHSVRAANNLARLYIWRRADHAVALDLLKQARKKAHERREGDKGVLYTLQKNLAWAYLGLSSADVAAPNVTALLEMAAEEIEAALQISETRGAAYCVRAQVSEKRGDPATAFDDWDRCLDHANQYDENGKVWTDVEPHWRAIAEARVNRGG